MFHGIFADNLFDSVAIAPQSLTMQSLAGCWSTNLREPWSISLPHCCIELGVQIHYAQRQLWNPQGSVGLSLTKARVATLSLLPLFLQPPADICVMIQPVNKCGLIGGNFCVFFKVFYTLCESLHEVRYKTCDDFSFLHNWSDCVDLAVIEFRVSMRNQLFFPIWLLWLQHWLKHHSLYLNLVHSIFSCFCVINIKVVIYSLLNFKYSL